MEPVDPAKRVTRSQLPLPDSHLSLTRSPLKDARIAQRSYHMDPSEPVPEDADTDDEILLSPAKKTHLNSRVNANSKRSASPSPQDEYTHSAAPKDGRELKRLKRDVDDADKRVKRDTEAGGSDVENTDTNIRTTATPSYVRNLSEPVVGASRKLSSKPRSTSRQTPASPKGKGRARSVPVFPVLDLSNPPVTPWRRRARSRSPSKDHDSPKLQITFSSLAPIPDEVAIPPPMLPSASLPDAELPTISAPVVIEPPSTPIASSARRQVFATPMSPLTPLPETPRPFQPRLDDGYPRTIGWGVDPANAQRIEGLPTAASDTSSLFPLIFAPSAPSTYNLHNAPTTEPPAADPPVADPPVAESPAPAIEPSAAPVEEPQLRDTAEATKATKAPVQSRLPRPSQSIMGPPPVPLASNVKASSKQMPLPPMPSSSSSTSTSGAPTTNAFSVMMASKSRGTAATAKSKGKGKEKEKVPARAPAPREKEKGKGKGKEKVEDKPKEEKKVSLKAKMRLREKPKPLPLPIHVRLPEESDGERTSTPTAGSRPETPTMTVDMGAAVSGPALVGNKEVPYRRFSSPLTDLDDEELPIDDDGPVPPPSSSPDLLSPAGGAQLNLPEMTMPAEALPVAPSKEGEAEAKGADGAAELPAPTPSADAVMDSVDEHIPPADADVSMSGEQGPAELQPPADAAAKPRPKSRVGKPRAPAPLPAPADRVTRSTSLKRKEAEGAPTQKKLFSFGIGPAAAVGNPAKKQKMSDEASSSNSQAGPSRSPTKIPMPSPSKMSSFANPTRASAARSAVTKTPAKSKPVSAAAAPSRSPSPSKNKLVRATSLFTSRPPPSFSRTFTAPNGNPSSLQTLASALERLRMPPPERPNTSMGFSRDDTDNTLAESTRSVDDRNIGMGRPSGGLQRASTVASIGSTSSSTSSVAGDASKPSTTSALKPALVQRPLSAFMGAKGGAGGASKLAVGTGSIMRGGPSVFGGASRVRSAPKVSRNPGLPSVIASPVKGGGGGEDGDDTMLEEELMGGGGAAHKTADADAVMERVTSPRGVTFDFSSIATFGASKKGKEKERLPEEWRQHASRRASMAGLDLSKSVSLPPKPIGLMGPPETPLDRPGMRSTSSSYPSSSSDSAEGMRRSTRIAKSASADTSIGDDDAAASEALQRPAATAVQPLTILKGCIVFVDIISDLGDDSARSFITEMLKNLGARVLGSVGQTCTHIVYKNGLRSTYTRYKALSDPKPLVVGMEWVVQSAEKRNHEDETPYLIDMDDMNTTATKRRKSMLPRLMSGGMDDSVDGEYSFDGSSSSVIMDDDLTPLERARLRKAGTTTGI
ncbi:hypothetical protein B0H17DRAFT_1179847 [Mycena rosella]|uniref:BRCT domain-containing protein n=1 Tax=Mycena rosella TaxID=1033263 RepID=A0AAD7GH69_MYCRO|nr:hypothetical protein B0H17DRAFT_1179847 [Mycena rosella]